MKFTISLIALLVTMVTSPTHARFLRSSGVDIDSSSSSWNKTHPTNLHDVQEKDMSPETRVVGGTLASENDFPWFVASTGGYFCGGSLLHSDIVMTAAHVSFTHSRADHLFQRSLNLLLTLYIAFDSV